MDRHRRLRGSRRHSDGIFVLGLELLADFPIHGMHGSMDHGMAPGRAGNAPKPDLLVIGHRSWREVHYLTGDPNQQFTTANEIHIPSGRAVNIEVESADVMHSFWVPSLHGKVDLIPGHPNFIRIEASQPGNFAGQCTEFCGVQHAHMRLLVVAQQPRDFEAWFAQQRTDGVEPHTAEAALGQQVFLDGPCSMCHQVRGTVAGGHVAPDLTHSAAGSILPPTTTQQRRLS